MKNIVHIVGTGTIGEPLIGLLARHKEKFGIDEVTFNKNTPLVHDKSKVDQLLARGAKLATSQDKMDQFRSMGMEPSFEKVEAIERATVVIDCTPSGVGLSNKREYYDKYKDRVKGFIAQGSEFGFGAPFAHGIVDRPDDQFIQVVSCNTHNISCLLKSLDQPLRSDIAGGIVSGDFVCIRRANDISQDSGFVPGPEVGKHGDPVFGTHHARDAYNLLRDQFPHTRMFSSAMKLNSQYMHSIRFKIEVKGDMKQDEVIKRFKDNPNVAMTQKKTSNSIFSFGRDYGLYGRILSQTVIYEPSVIAQYNEFTDSTLISGFCFTPQDGNSLLSSISAALYFIDPDTADDRLSQYNPYIFQEI